MTELTDLTFGTVQRATETHGDREKTLDAVTVDRWAEFGKDRLYLNGVFTKTTDAYVDLKSETVHVVGTATRSETLLVDDETLIVTIERPSSTFDIVVEPAEDSVAEADEVDTDEDGDDDGANLERFGVDV